MTITERKDGTNPADSVICPRCSASLPSYARFCGSCGEQIKKEQNEEGQTRTQSGDNDTLEQESDDTLRIQSLSGERFKDLLLDLSLKNAGTLIRHPWVLVRSLVDRVRNHSLLRNSISIIGTGVATSILGYFFWILAAHLYSDYDIGLGAALISSMTLASIIANLGIGSTLVHILPHKEAGYPWSLTLNAGLATGIVTSLLTGAIAVVALPLVSQQFVIVGRQVDYALSLILGVPIMTVSMLLDQAFIAERSAHYMLVRNAAVALLKIPLMVLAVLLMTQVGALGILLSWVVAMAVVLIGGLLLVSHLRRGYRLTTRGIVGQVRSMLSLLTGNYFINLGGLTASYLLPVLVLIRLSPADNAYYYIATRVGDFLLIGSAEVATSLFAEGSHAPGDLARKVRSSAKILAVLLGSAILFCFLGGGFILSLFGQKYAQHGLTLLRLEAISALPDAITNIYVSVLRIQRRLRFAALLNVCMAALTLVLVWILLPALGIAGVPVAFIIAQGIGSLVAGVDFIRLRHRRKANISALSSDADCAETANS